MAAKFIIDVTELDFEYEVLKYSQNTPVVVHFWASWSKSSKALDPILERLATEANGNFRLARVDVDVNPNLILKYGVRTIPTVKAVSQGEVVSEFVDVIPENRVREFLNQISRPSPVNLAVEKAFAILDNHQWTAAEKLFRQILENNPEEPPILLGLAKATLAQGKGIVALQILRNFPTSRAFKQAETLLPYAETLVAYQQNLLPDDNELDSTFSHCIQLANRGNIPAAIDGLLDVLRSQRTYRNGKARQVVLSLLELLGEDDPQTREYRSELAAILF